MSDAMLGFAVGKEDAGKALELVLKAVNNE